MCVGSTVSKPYDEGLRKKLLTTDLFIPCHVACAVDVRNACKISSQKKKHEIRDIGIKNNIKINLTEVGRDDVGLTKVASINPLSTKFYLSDLKTQFVPRRKHTLHGL